MNFALGTFTLWVSIIFGIFCWDVQAAEMRHRPHIVCTSVTPTHFKPGWQRRPVVDFHCNEWRLIDQ